MNDQSDVLSPVCPFCGAEPYAYVSYTQWICSTDNCPCFMWNPRVTPAENKRNSKPMGFERTPLPGEGAGE